METVTLEEIADLENHKIRMLKRRTIAGWTDVPYSEISNDDLETIVKICERRLQWVNYSLARASELEYGDCLSRKRLYDLHEDVVSKLLDVRSYLLTRRG
jgi:hypothetical protein